MIYRGLLPSRGRWPDLNIEWDSDSGEFDGPDADRAAEFVERTVESGSVELLPCLNHHFTGGPLTAEEIGSILNELWDVAGVFPLLEVDPEIPPGAVS